jgi:hypothetical protein
MTDYKINVKGTEIIIFRQRDDDYISLTDIAKYKNPDETSLVISHWLRTRYAINFLGIWEQMNNPNFNTTEFGSIKNQSGENGFVLTSKQWVEKTNAIGIISKSGRYGGGTFAHKDIAFEFASWISPEFKLYLIKEFQRLKEEENERLMLGWNIKRNLAKINYKVHTDAIQTHLIPNRITQEQANFVYSSEADVLNKALFNMTAKEWRKANPEKDGNIRDYADVSQLVCLSNLESFNAEFIRNGLKQSERLIKLNEIAIIQMRSLIDNPGVKRLGK